MKTYVIGDIHGNYKALKQVIGRSPISKKEDILIVLGDVVDGYPDVVGCIDELLTFKNLIGIWGNHDDWAHRFLKTGWKESVWLDQGGLATLKSYTTNPEKQQEHLDKYFSNLKYYHVIDDKCFVHGGFDWHSGDATNTDPQELMWDRHMVEVAQIWQAQHDIRKIDLQKFPFYSRIFVGHTDTRYNLSSIHVPSSTPQFLSNLIMLDTGAGWKGKLTIMDVDSLEYWQSDESTSHEEYKK